MTPDFVPIVVPSVDWATFLKVAGEGLGYSPVRIADQCPRDLTDPAKFVVVAASFQDKTVSNAVEALRGSLDLLQHLQFVFVVYGDPETILQIMERTELGVTMTQAVDGERLAIVSGNLRQWYTATTTCCVQRAPYNLRLLFDKFVFFFERLGLAELWNGTRKRTLPDKTFLLEYK